VHARNSTSKLAQGARLVSAANSRADELQRRLEEQQDATRTQRVLELEHRQLAAPGSYPRRGHHERSVRERARALSYFDLLRSAEGRRMILEGLVTDLQHEAQGRKGELGRVALGAHQPRRAGARAGGRARAARGAYHAARAAGELVRHGAGAARHAVREITARGAGVAGQCRDADRARGLTTALESARAATLAASAQAAGHEAARRAAAHPQCGGGVGG